ncbi:MAG: hypothetical protein HC915_14085 [Anaerolineae bacterium]|nr:hypothetical protein [Anaerolineae bacterium]
MRPVIDEGPFSYHHVNHEQQSLAPDSFLNWLTRALRVRRTCPEFGDGAFDLLEVDSPCVLAHRCRNDHGEVIALHNLSGETVQVSLQIPGGADRMVDLIGLRQVQQWPERQQQHPFELSPYGYHWLRIYRY